MTVFNAARCYFIPRQAYHMVNIVIKIILHHQTCAKKPIYKLCIWNSRELWNVFASTSPNFPQNLEPVCSKNTSSWLYVYSRPGNAALNIISRNGTTQQVVSSNVASHCPWRNSRTSCRLVFRVCSFRAIMIYVEETVLTRSFPQDWIKCLLWFNFTPWGVSGRFWATQCVHASPVQREKSFRRYTLVFFLYIVFFIYFSSSNQDWLAGRLYMSTLRTNGRCVSQGQGPRDMIDHRLHIWYISEYIKRPEFSWPSSARARSFAL